MLPDVIHRWLSTRRLNKTYADDRFITQIPSISPEWDEKVFFDLDLDGQRVAFHTPSMQNVDPNAFHINPGSIGWTNRTKPYYEHQLDDAQKVVNFLKLRKAELWYGVPFCRISGVTYYLNHDSIRPNYVVLYTSWTKEIRVPKAAFSNFAEGTLLKPEIYTMHPIDLTTCKKVEDWKPIIEMKAGNQGVNSAYTALTEVSGCPGVLDFQANDILINVDVLDNSAFPIIDLKDFLQAIRDGFTHVTTRWTLNIEQIQLQIGMNPKPIRVIDLASELPEHRIILSDVPCKWSVEEYHNTGNLPTTYP